MDYAIEMDEFPETSWLEENRLGEIRFTRSALIETICSLDLQAAENISWIVHGCQLALYYTLKGTDCIPPDRRAGQKSLKKISRLANQIVVELLELNPHAVQFIEGINCATGFPPRTGWQKNKGRAPFPERLEHLDDELRWLHEAASKAATVLSDARQPPKWRQRYERDRRILFAWTLIPVFERGFARTAAINRWTQSYGSNSLGDWERFFSALNGLAFKEKAVPDLEGILDEARALFTKEGVIFDPDDGQEFPP